jgi:hypothetical protein
MIIWKEKVTEITTTKPATKKFESPQLKFLLVTEHSVQVEAGWLDVIFRTKLIAH